MYGHKACAEWLYNLSKTDGNTKININAIREKAFSSACYNKHKHITEWLYNLSKTDGNQKINIHIDDSIFDTLCEKGIKSMAEWLYNLSKTDGNGKIRINTNGQFAFRSACIGGHKNTAKWLYKLSKMDDNESFDIHSNNEEIFRTTCFYGKTVVAKWLYKISVQEGNPINITAGNDGAFRQSCGRGYIKIAEWLCTLNDKYTIKYDERLIFKYIPRIKNIKTFLEENNASEINKIVKSLRLNNDDICMICRCNDDKYWIGLDCDHKVCSGCFINIDKCPLRCTEEINQNRVNIYQISISA